MDKDMNEKIIDEAVKKFKNGEIKSMADVENYLDGLLQPLMQKLLDAELENHLEYSKYEHSKNKKDNTRNGYCKEKNVQTKYGKIKVKTPRDRNGSFEPVLIEKGQTKLPGFEEKCISLYAKGMSTRDIEKILRELYSVKISKDQVTTLINAVNEEVYKWKNRPLEPIYTFVYADCLYVYIKDDLVSEKKAVYVILGVNKDGYKDILGIWIDKSESASFWTGVFEDLKQRGVQDILYVTSDGIAGFKGSLEKAFPKTNSQRCVVHLARNIYKLCPKKQASKIMQGFKKIYTSPSLEAAEIALENFKNDFPNQTKIIKKIENFMQYLEPLFELPTEIRKVIYTSNAIESVNSALRKVTNGKGSFPSEESLYKVLFLRVRELKEKWKRPIMNFKTIRIQLIQIFGDRYTKYLDM
ncbi:MAG: IS256 family transposase [Clostridia bacterium]|nr:IS256 family transposase [Bacilli bacterium]MBR3255862.1 IS256 family transposase [Clostridia bacterium]